MPSPPKLQGYVDGMKVYEFYVDCPMCQDTGFVTLIHPETMWHIKRSHYKKDYPEFQIRTCAAICTCEYGQAKAITRLPVYGDQRYHIRLNEPDCIDKCARYVDRPLGFNEEFAEYAQ